MKLLLLPLLLLLGQCCLGQSCEDALKDKEQIIKELQTLNRQLKKDNKYLAKDLRKNGAFHRDSLDEQKKRLIRELKVKDKEIRELKQEIKVDETVKRELDKCKKKLSELKKRNRSLSLDNEALKEELGKANGQMEETPPPMNDTPKGITESKENLLPIETIEQEKQNVSAQQAGAILESASKLLIQPYHAEKIEKCLKELAMITTPSLTNRKDELVSLLGNYCSANNNILQIFNSVHQVGNMEIRRAIIYRSLENLAFNLADYPHLKRLVEEKKENLSSNDISDGLTVIPCAKKTQ